MINIISRSIVFKNITGPQKVVANLIKGLEKLNYPYVVNKRLDYCERLYIHDDRSALMEISKLDPKIKILVGPNLYVVPRDIPGELDISRAVYLVPSEWNKRFWLHFGFSKCPMESWAAGIDTREFLPSDKPKEFILIYWKQRSENELNIIKGELEKRDLPYKILHYDKGYAEENFRKILSKTRYVIWLGRQESQGIALQEILASNVPVLVCDVESVGHCVGGGELNSEEKDYKDTTSAEYFDGRCGVKIKNLININSAIEKMESGFNGFSPREYILENLSLEGQAKKLINLYEKHFNMPYDAGEVFVSGGDSGWRNAKPEYIFYLKVKHGIKMALVRMHLWNFISWIIRKIS